MLRSGIDVSLRAVHHDDTLFCRSLQIDIVDADTRSSNNPQLLASFHQRCSDLCLTADNESIVVSDDLLQLFGAETFAFVHLQGGLQHLESIWRDFFWDEDFWTGSVAVGRIFG